MGYAVAEAALERGWSVELVSGPVALDAPAGVELTTVETAGEMLAACLARFPACDLVVMAAAVCDHRPVRVAERKLKKAEMSPTFEMEPTQDILAELGKCRSEGQALIGFAAETNDCEANGLEKLRAKNLDWIAVNDVGADGRGFGSGENEVTLLGADGSTVHLGPAAKLEVARRILEVVRP